jgi:hypothetical protein
VVAVSTYAGFPRSKDFTGETLLSLAARRRKGPDAEKWNTGPFHTDCYLVATINARIEQVEWQIDASPPRISAI